MLIEFSSLCIRHFIRTVIDVLAADVRAPCILREQSRSIPTTSATDWLTDWLTSSSELGYDTRNRRKWCNHNNSQTGSRTWRHSQQVSLKLLTRFRATNSPNVPVNLVSPRPVLSRLATRYLGYANRAEVFAWNAPCVPLQVQWRPTPGMYDCAIFTSIFPRGSRWTATFNRGVRR